jgi:hypothetical protein
MYVKERINFIIFIILPSIAAMKAFFFSYDRTNGLYPSLIILSTISSFPRYAAQYIMRKTVSTSRFLIKLSDCVRSNFKLIVLPWLSWSTSASILVRSENANLLPTYLMLFINLLYYSSWLCNWELWVKSAAPKLLVSF